MTARRVDGNQAEIVEALRNRGVSVFCLHEVGHGMADIVCGYRGSNFLFEIKAPGARMTPAELQFQTGWHGQVDTVRTADEAWDLILDCVSNAE